MRPTFAEIDLGSIAHNVSAFVDLVAPSELCAVVKADAYGHGDVPVAFAAIRAGATWLAVALVEEGVRLREAGIDVPILLLSEPTLDSVEEVVGWGLTPTVYSLAFIEALAHSGAHLDLHLKIDTGMHRVGAAPHLALDLHAAVEAAPRLNLSGMWTHFAVAEQDLTFTERQIGAFDEVVRGLPDVPMLHMANTAGSILVPHSRQSMCRVGLGIYGLYPSPACRDEIALKPAMRLVSEVSNVQRLEAGVRPSYGRLKALTVDSTVVTAPVGYADGVSRRLSLNGCALIDGKRYPFAGMITMDQLLINVGDADVHRGDEVVLLGDQGRETISAEDWAKQLDTVSYEIVCSIGPRVTRRFLK